jgi:hypothetical protein
VNNFATRRPIGKVEQYDPESAVIKPEEYEWPSMKPICGSDTGFLERSRNVEQKKQQDQQIDGNSESKRTNLSNSGNLNSLSFGLW